MKTSEAILQTSLVFRVLQWARLLLLEASRHSFFLRLYQDSWDLSEHWDLSLPGRVYGSFATSLNRLSNLSRVPSLIGTSLTGRFLNVLGRITATSAWKESLFVRALDLSAGSEKGKAPWCLTLVLGFVLLVIPFVPTTTVVVLVWASAILAFLLRFLGARFAIPRSIAAPGTAFAVVLVLSAVTSVSVSSSLEALVLWVTYLVLAFLLAVSLDDMEKVGFALLCLLISAALAGGYGLYQFSKGIETQSGWLDKEAAKSIQTRAYSVFDNPNIFATYLAFLIPSVTYLFLNAKRWLSRLFLFPIGILMAGGLAVTYTRGAWIGSAVGLILLGLFKDRKVLCLFLLLILLAPLLFPSTVVERVSSIGSLEDSSNRYRITIWKATWLMVKDYWASGVGLGPVPFALVYPLYEIAGTPTVHTHNLYLQLVVEMGVPGLLAFLWLLRTMSRGGFRACHDPYHAGIAAALMAGLIGQIIYGFVDNIWYSPKNLFLFWAVAGMILASRGGMEAA